MKSIFVICVMLVISSSVHGQILKKILNQAKNSIEWKTRSTVDQKINEAVDSLLSKPKKEQTSAPGFDTTHTQTSASPDQMQLKEGYVSISLSSDQVFTNDIVVITGSSVKYGNMKEVTISIAGPILKNKTVALDDQNKYVTTFQPGEAGTYNITATSSDGKAIENVELTVKDKEAGDWTEDNREEVNKAYELIIKQTDRVKSQVSQKEKAEIEKKLELLRKDVEGSMKFFNELSKAKKELANKKLHADLEQNVSKINNALYQHRLQMKQIRETADHEPFDNTICEYITMVKEAALAFDMLTSWVKIPLEICKQLVKDYTNLNENTPSAQAASAASTPAKIFALSKLDAESVSVTDFTNDLVQYVSEFLLKKYCGALEGNLQQDYQITYRNELGSKWWEYNYRTKSTLSLRYPKTNTGAGRIIKMKGSIEGNAIQFNFYQDIELMDDFRKEIKQKGKVIPVQLHTPFSVPIGGMLPEGVGVVTRGMLTPAYFYIPVDAEYDPQANTIKLFLNTALMDFSTLVTWKMGYIVLAAGIPLVTTVDFPINKAYLTMNAVISQKNEFNVTETPNGLSFSGNGDRQIGNERSSIQHKINFTISAKSQ